MPDARWVAPGRVNLIGEHTDYNQGLALPFATPQACVAEVRRGHGGLVATSAQRGEQVRADTVEQVPALTTWARYVLGPAWVLASRGVEVPPLEVRVDSDVPLGAGLSSSAAVICSVSTALLDLLGVDLDPEELLTLTREVENDVVGAPTGGLDQMASLWCRPGHALLCDFRDLSTRDVALDVAASGLALVVTDTRVEHQHAEGEYAARRDTCDRAAQTLGVESLREISFDRLDSALASLAEHEARRCVRHVVTENQRVCDVVALLEAGRPADVGQLLSASHDSLRDDYRVTVPALDLAQATLLGSGALGARMTGGGFGGCVVALLSVDLVPTATEATASAFAGRGLAAPRSFVVEPSGGAHRASRKGPG